jgi:hypothetical protein
MAEYQLIPGLGKLEQNRQPHEPVDMARFSVELRSSEDPFLTLLAVTHGTLEFGASSSELARNAIFLLGLSCCFALPCAWIWCLREDSRCAFLGRRSLTNPSENECADFNLVATLNDRDNL